MPLLPFSGPVIPTPVPISKGGTGSSTQNFVDLSSTQNVGGTKTFTSDITGHNYLFSANNTYNVGSSSNYAQYIYGSRLYLNSTAYLDGGTSGQVTLTAGNASGGYGLYVTPPLLTSTSATLASIEVIAGFQPTADTSGRLWGLQFALSTYSNNNFTNSIGALTGVEGYSAHRGGGTVTAAVGALLYARNASTGTITNAIGIYGYGIQNTSTGTITNAYNIRLNDAYVPSGTITNSYGLYINSMTASTNNYAIYTNTGAVHFGDIVQFAGTNTTGAGSAALGWNSPATTNTAPYTWIEVKTSDGSTAYIPAWK